jgi:hypothetical protein
LQYKVITMTSQQTAIEHLRVIRSLLEKSQTYRSISAPAALFGGTLALVAAFASLRFENGDVTSKLTTERLLLSWLSILGITTAVNFFLLHREATGRGQPFVSEGMRTALRAFLPPMLVGGVLGICLILLRGEASLGALVWVLCYGLALLSTSHFSPRSLLRLGWAFLVVGLGFTLWHLSRPIQVSPEAQTAMASLYLGATFGALHIAYAVAVFLRRPPTREMTEA